MNVLRTDEFIADIENQYNYYSVHAGFEVADGHLDAVDATCRLLSNHPHLGPRGGFTHPRLQEWRFFLVFRPFSKHILFYEEVGNDLILRRAMHGHQDIPRRLVPPEE
jgi:plasmid stabilization system protein ParE